MIETGGASPERYYDITWNQDNGIDGDIDRDNSALISMFYSDSDSFAVREGSRISRRPQPIQVRTPISSHPA